MDVSDGLARDLHRLCRASGVGAEVDAEALPFSDRFATLCEAIGADPLALALGGGEDYVLLFTLPEGDRAAGGARRAAHRQDHEAARRGAAARRETRPAAGCGWDHLTAHRGKRSEMQKPRP